MEVYKIQWIETLVVVVVYVIAFFLIKNVINATLKKTHFDRTRRKIIIKATHLFTTIGALVVLGSIWGLKQHQIAVFASSLLAAFGIAFFAQWSLLSNITSCIILFFNHPLKLGDTIKILDKDFPFEGEITELTYFFVHLKSADGSVVTIPNSLFLQKSIVVVDKAGSLNRAV